MNITKQELNKYAHSYMMYTNYRDLLIGSSVGIILMTITCIIFLISQEIKALFYVMALSPILILTMYIATTMAKYHAEVITSIIKKFEEEEQ